LLKNTTLLVVVDKFDSKHVLVNINKLKPYRTLESTYILQLVYPIELAILLGKELPQGLTIFTMLILVYLINLSLIDCSIDLLVENLTNIFIFTIQYYMCQLLFIIIELIFNVDSSQEWFNYLALTLATNLHEPSPFVGIVNECKAKREIQYINLCTITFHHFLCFFKKDQGFYLFVHDLCVFYKLAKEGCKGIGWLNQKKRCHLLYFFGHDGF